MNGKPVALGKMIMTFCVFFALGTALVWPALEYPMTWDDLHLIRSFSRHEILSSFRNNWDPDGIETPGLRPFTLLFNHARYAIWGENVIVHRLFLLCLYAFYLTMLCRAASALGFPWKLAIVAGALSLVAKYNLYHYLWIVDGIHLAQGLLFSSAIVFLIKFLSHSHYLSFVWSWLAVVCGILLREDTIAVIPVIIIWGYACLAREKQSARISQMHVYAVIALAAAAAFMAYRRAAVPEVPPLKLNVLGMLAHLVYSFNFMGLKHFDALSMAFIYGWFVALVALVVACVRYRAIVVSRAAVLWLVCAFIACSPGLSVSRINLLLFSITFTAFFLCTILWKISRISRFWKSAAIGIAIWAFIGSFYMSSVNIQAFHPHSAVTIQWNSDFIYGAFAEKATIPNDRHQMVASQLAAVGIFSWEDVSRRLPGMVAKALQENRRRPERAGGLFVPRLGLFDDSETLKKLMAICKDQFRNFTTNLK